jgi:uncharacterized membrane protein YfcA
MNVHDVSARDRQLLAIGLCLLSAAVLALLGAPRFAVYSAVVAVSFAVLVCGPSEQRIPPEDPNKPIRVAAPASAAAGFVGLVVGTLVLFPNPQYMILSTLLPFVFAVTWLRARR